MDKQQKIELIINIAILISCLALLILVSIFKVSHCDVCDIVYGNDVISAKEFMIEYSNICLGQNRTTSLPYVNLSNSLIE